MPKQITIDLGDNLTLLVAYANSSGDVSVRVDYSIKCDEIGGEISRSLEITLPPGLEQQQKNIIKNFVIPLIEADAGF